MRVTFLPPERGRGGRRGRGQVFPGRWFRGPGGITNQCLIVFVTVIIAPLVVTVVLISGSRR